MVETLFFDLDNTLLDFNQAERAAITKNSEKFSHCSRAFNSEALQ